MMAHGEEAILERILPIRSFLLVSPVFPDLVLVQINWVFLGSTQRGRRPFP